MSWHRFSPIAYYLSEKGLAFPLQQTKTSVNGSHDGQISIWELLKELEGKNYRIDDQFTQLVVTTEYDSQTLRAGTCILSLTNLLLESWKQGIKPLHLRWFWLETHIFDAGTSHSFFVVDEERDRIVCEEMTLVEGPETRSKFDRAFFERHYSSRFSGLAAYWYGRFYQETKLGKRRMAASGWIRPKVFYRADLRSDLRVIRFLLVAILVCLIVLLVRR